jgi:spore coat-associated protein N
MSNLTATKSSLRGNTRKIMLSLGAVGAAAAVAGMGTFGTFTSTTSGSEAVNSGTVAIALGTGAASTLNVAAVNIVPGDTIQRAVTLNNTGNSDLGAVTLTTAATPINLLSTDATDGLQLKIDSCSVAWTAVAPLTAPTYTCSGTKTTVLAAKPVIGANTAITTRATTAATTDNLVVTLTLPTTADNTFQNLNSAISFTFDATQRVAASR